MLRRDLRVARIFASPHSTHTLASLLVRVSTHPKTFAAITSRQLHHHAHASTHIHSRSRSQLTRRHASTQSPSSSKDKSDLSPSPEDKEVIEKQDAAIVKSALGTDAEEPKPQQAVLTTATPSTPAKKPAEEKKLTLWEKVKKEAAHYRDGTKLLGFEIKVSFKLALKMAAGHELTRREWRQLKRTVQDLVRLIPFSAFVIVPFAELLLPVALKIFPNMLPSTFEGKKAKEAKSAKLATTRKGVSEFLRKTVQESGLPLSATTKQRDEFVDFFRKVKSSGAQPTKDDIIKVCRIFKDDLTLDNLSRPQLVAMCRYMNLSSFGTDGVLRYVIRTRMRQIKRDDKAIAYEGVTSLSIPELHHACQSRGIRTHGVSPGHLRDELKGWLDLRLKHRVPSTLLILSKTRTTTL
ncbi:LETM1 domain-containing protein ylh47 [Savitreella phatthalungensis]